MARNLTPAGVGNAKRLVGFRNKHKGETCVIIGNGPSLKKTDMSLVGTVPTFGLNRVYLAFPELGFETTYLAVVNRLVVEQIAPDLRDLRIPIFTTWPNRHDLGPQSNIHYLSSAAGPSFSTDIVRGLWEGATVTYVALQVAAYMGFSRIILVGVDHSFSTTGTPHQVVTSEGDDPNHFSGAYFGKGFRWQLPDLQTSEFAYQLARSSLEDRGVEVIDATVGGKLDVFRKSNLEALL